MSMSVSINGVRDLDGQFAKMAAVKEACDKAGIGYPSEINDYFKYPTDNVKNLSEEMSWIEIDEAVSKGGGDGYSEWIIDLSKLPKECKKICVHYG